VELEKKVIYFIEIMINMDQNYEERWCKYCMIKTKQEIIFLPKIPTYKRKRQYKCTVCGHKIWLQARRPSAESVY